MISLNKSLKIINKISTILGFIGIATILLATGAFWTSTISSIVLFYLFSISIFCISLSIVFVGCGYFFLNILYKQKKVKTFILLARFGASYSNNYKLSQIANIFMFVLGVTLSFTAVFWCLKGL